MPETPRQAALASREWWRAARKAARGSFDDEGGVSLELHIGVDRGVNFSAVSRSIMNEVSYKLAKSTGIPVKSVDVYIDTIIG